MKSNKTNWIKAYRTTLNEYKNGTHACNDLCAKCTIGLSEYGNCTNCIEKVFNYDTLNNYGYCLRRKNKPIHMLIPYNTNLFGKQVNNVILYHKEAIKFLKSIPAKDFNNADFSELVKIDKSIK